MFWIKFINNCFNLLVSLTLKFFKDSLICSILLLKSLTISLAIWKNKLKIFLTLWLKVNCQLSSPTILLICLPEMTLSLKQQNKLMMEKSCSFHKSEKDWTDISKLLLRYLMIAYLKLLDFSWLNNLKILSKWFYSMSSIEKVSLKVWVNLNKLRKREEQFQIE